MTYHLTAERSAIEGANRTPHDSRYTKGERACEPAMSPIRPSRVPVSLLRVTHPAKDAAKRTPSAPSAPSILVAVYTSQEGVTIATPVVAMVTFAFMLRFDAVIAPVVYATTIVSNSRINAKVEFLVCNIVRDRVQ
jgi:hypothetical protein